MTYNEDEKEIASTQQVGENLTLGALLLPNQLTFNTNLTGQIAENSINVSVSVTDNSESGISENAGLTIENRNNAVSLGVEHTDENTQITANYAYSGDDIKLN